MYSKSYWLLFLVPLLTAACTDVKSTRYQDTSELETPPVMKIVEKPKAISKDLEKEENKGLGDIVKLAGPAELPVIHIKKMFNRSWAIVEQGLNLSEIEITDKNREEGTYYLKFDPDDKSSKDSSMMDSMAFFLFKDDYEEAAYKLSVVWKESNTEVSVELIDAESDDLLDDGEDDFEGSVDPGAKLIRALYKTIRDDLPID